MMKLDLPVSEADAPNLIEEFWAARGLVFKRISLVTRADCIHWHTRNPPASGTLEVTYCPNSSKFEIVVRSNRAGEWIAYEIDALTQEFSRRVQES